MNQLINFMNENNISDVTIKNDIKIHGIIFDFKDQKRSYHIFIENDDIIRLEQKGLLEEYIIRKIKELMPISEDSVESRLKESYPYYD